MHAHFRLIVHDTSEIEHEKMPNSGQFESVRTGNA